MTTRQANLLWLLCAAAVILVAICGFYVQVEMTMHRISDAGGIVAPVMLRVYLSMTICWATFFALRRHRRRLANKTLHNSRAPH